MQKIPTLFKRDPENRRYVTPEVTPGCEWVLEGEGIATRKFDGTCVMFDGVIWWARREVKPDKEPPLHFVPVSSDPETGKVVGWEPIDQSPFVKFFEEAIKGQYPVSYRQGTYELCGPKINKNPEQFSSHVLIRHGETPIPTRFARNFADIKLFCLEVLKPQGIEGIVFWHPDGRKAKIKVRDFKE